MAKAHPIHQELSERNDKESILELIPKYREDNFAMAMIYDALVRHAENKKEQIDFAEEADRYMKKYIHG